MKRHWRGCWTPKPCRESSWLQIDVSPRVFVQVWILELAIVLAFIWIGARLGSIGIGFAGGAGVVVLTLGFGVQPGEIPIDVILIIMSVISAIAAMQIAGGLDYLVQLAERLLRRNPRQITILAPVVTYLMTLFAGTGHTAFSTLPVIAEVARKGGVRPSRPLAIATVASQVAITASPISAAVVFMASTLEAQGVSYLQLLLICIPTSFAAVMVGAVVTSFLGKELEDDPEYQKRVASGWQAKGVSTLDRELMPGAKRSVGIFCIAILAVVGYATAISPSIELIASPVLPRNEAIIAFMLTAATAISLLCQVDTTKVLNASVFKSGMSACICVLGVAWLGNTFVSAHLEEIRSLASGLLEAHPWLLAIVLFFASMLLYSQAATTKTLMPVAFSMGVTPYAAIAAFPAVNALFVLPTYPTLLAAVEFDETGTTRIGKLVFDHPFLIPGLVTIVAAVVFGFLVSPIVLQLAI